MVRTSSVVGSTCAAAHFGRRYGVALAPPGMGQWPSALSRLLRAAVIALGHLQEFRAPSLALALGRFSRPFLGLLCYIMRQDILGGSSVRLGLD
jgi:hypothetical protein